MSISRSPAVFSALMLDSATAEVFPDVAIGTPMPRQDASLQPQHLLALREPHASRHRLPPRPARVIAHLPRLTAESARRRYQIRRLDRRASCRPARCREYQHHKLDGLVVFVVVLNSRQTAVQAQHRPRWLYLAFTLDPAGRRHDAAGNRHRGGVLAAHTQECGWEALRASSL
jgi:hypothetical protein